MIASHLSHLTALADACLFKRGGRSEGKGPLGGLVVFVLRGRRVMERQQVGQRARASAALLNCQWPIRTTVPCASITTNPLLGASRDIVGGSQKAQTVETAQGPATHAVRCQP